MKWHFQNVNADNLLCLLLPTARLLPWRNQPDVCFVITYDAWRTCVKSNFDICKQYSTRLRVSDGELTKKDFYIDLAFAQRSEIKYCGERGTGILGVDCVMSQEDLEAMVLSYNTENHLAFINEKLVSLAKMAHDSDLQRPLGHACLASLSLHSNYDKGVKSL